jgi:hypothetical protein
MSEVLEGNPIWLEKSFEKMFQSPGVFGLPLAEYRPTTSADSSSFLRNFTEIPGANGWEEEG